MLFTTAISGRYAKQKNAVHIKKKV